MRYWVHVPGKPHWCGYSDVLRVAQLAVEAAGSGRVFDLAAPVGHALLYSYSPGLWTQSMTRPDGKFKDSRQAARNWKAARMKMLAEAGVTVDATDERTA